MNNDDHPGLETTRFRRLEQLMLRLNEAFLAFGPDPDANIGRLTRLCDELRSGADAPTDDDRQLLGLMAGAIRVEEERRAMKADLENSVAALERVNAQLKQNQAQLVQSEKLASIGQLAAGVAHEINNPIGFITSNLNALKDYAAVMTRLLQEYEAVVGALPDRAALPPALQARLESIAALRKKEDLNYILGDLDHLIAESTDGTRRVKEIVQSLMSFARVDEAQVREADVNECLENTLRVVWNELKYKCEIRKEYGALPPLRCHPGQLNQVFMNLLVNAAQAIPDKGVITVHTEADADAIVIRISDTGMGIPKEHLPRLFTPFFTTKPAGKGTGLGLSIAYGIVQKHGGHIEVESEVGKGTTFAIRLPRGGLAEA